MSIFQQAGVPLPEGTWTLDQFIDALRTLKDYLDKTPFVSHNINGESLMMLIAAYGGLPIDYRTSPATFNFTDPATVDAIQQVLDLAKNGYIDYHAACQHRCRFQHRGQRRRSARRHHQRLSGRLPPD